MKRFTRTAAKRRPAGTALGAAVLCVCAVLALFLYGMNRVNRGSVVRQQEALEDAVNRDITLCYAWEGHYPKSVKYLEDHYGLTYDKQTFAVKVQLRGANIRPYVVVIRRDGSEGT
ncbi:MAG: hypothetical protein DUD26_06655 [Eubacteriaceae bacterium]|nr:MAG: hypothetical protein DUD26_06655 [Eubacteriaceae bacterium]